MGGSAFGQPTPRLDLQQYERVVQTLTAKLCPVFFGRVHAPRHLPSKQSFGDVDLIVSEPRGTLEPQKDLKASVSIRNGDTTSLMCEGFQVDLIKVSEANFGTSLLCFDFGDTGMIIGMMMRNLGMKFGLKGLTLKLETHKLKLSQSRQEILAFLGLSESAWTEGFTSEDALFRWLQSSRYFRPSFYKQTIAERQDAERRVKENCSFEQPIVWNREARYRVRQRPMFRQWLQHVSTLPANEDRIDTTRVRDEALAFFGKRLEYDRIVQDLSLRRRIKSKFNGQLAIAWTDGAVVGKELGEMMAAFKSRATDLDSMEPEQIRDAFVQFAQTQPHLM